MLFRAVAIVNTTIRTGVLVLAVAIGVGAAAARSPSLPSPSASTEGDDVFLAARDAVRTGDRDRLAAAAARLGDHPLYPWIEYWQVQMQLRSDDAARVDETVKGFFAKHPGSYLADRLRMEWLQALGARRDFDTFLREWPPLVWQHDDHQVRCWAALARYERVRRSDGAGDGGRTAAAVARDASDVLETSREPSGDGCVALTEALVGDGRVSALGRIRALVENNQVSTARRLAGSLRGIDGAQVAQAIDRSAAWLAQNERRLGDAQREVAMIAIARLARDNPGQAAGHAASLNLRFTPAQRGLVWGRIGHMAAYKHDPQAIDWYRRGGEQVGVAPETARADEVLEWQARAALRGDAGGPDWAMLQSTIARMPADLQREPAWIYWQGRALQAGGRYEHARSMFRSIAGAFSFYGKLAAEELGEPITIPPPAPPPAPELVASFEGNAGLERALRLLDLGMRAEGSREWGWQLRGRSDRELLAIAEYARRRGSIDRMISSSERTRSEFDFAQRFPAPHREELVSHAQAAGIDETWVYGLIRQESRFISDARSTVGAQGLMQLMPATARYVARRVGMSDYKPQRITELEVNLRLGTSYLRFVLDDLDGHPVLASAAYNAGPSRLRQWRSTLSRPVEGAIFAETIPFNETRDYVKKVMSNTVYYAALFDSDKAPSLRKRLGVVGPKAAGQTELP